MSDLEQKVGDEEGAFGDAHVSAPPPHKPKDPRSKYKYNILCRLLFLWVEAIFCVGVRRDLEQSDLYAHPKESDSEKLHKKFKKYWAHELDRKRRGLKPRLWMPMIKAFWWKVMLTGVIQFVEILLIVGQAVLLGYLTRYFSLPCDERTEEETRNAYIYAAGVVVIAVSVALAHGHGFLLGQKIGMNCRIMTTAAIYEKVLTLSQVTIGQVSIGHIVNLASNDVQRFDMAFIFVNMFWIAPVHLVLATFLIAREVGWPAVLPALIIVFQAPVQILLARDFARTRFKSAKETDKRVRIMNEVITGIRVIKMYAWEYAFKRVVTAIRKRETKLIRYGGIIRALTSAFNFAALLQFMMGVTFLAFVGSGGELTSQSVFTTLAILHALRRTGGAFLIRSFFLAYEASVAVSRIQKFLLLGEVFPSSEEQGTVNGSTGVSFNPDITEEGYFRPESPWLPGTRKVEVDAVELRSYTTHTPAPDSPSSLSVNGLAASWKEGQDKMVLRNISFDLDHAAPLLAVVGPVGSGKSTLLQCLLGELDPVEGNIQLSGSLSYASQDPWVFTGTVRENILFGHPYHKERYQQVITACALLQDIDVLVDGDLTLVGERGVTLSGGQKARVNLARAVYHDADIYLLDDPLSAVDTGVGKHLFEECIRGFLKDKLVVLVTHQVHFALQGDKLLALKDGEIHIYGSHSELSERNIDTTQLLGLIHQKEDERDEFAYKDDDSEEENVRDRESKFQRMCSVEEAKSPRRRRRRVVFKSESDEEGDTVSLRSAGSVLSLDSEAEGGIQESEMFHRASVAPPAEEKAHGSVSMKTYVNFFRAGANYLSLLIVIIIFLLGEACIVVVDWWLSDWASYTEQMRSVNQTVEVNNSCFRETNMSMADTSLACPLSDTQRMAIYAALVVNTVLVNLLRGVLFYIVCINASRVLHNRMFRSILRTSVLFFDTNPSGRVLNRFSKDTGFLDDLLPQTFLEYLVLFTRFMAIICVAAAANLYLLIPLPVIILVFLAVRWYFLKTSRDVKRLEAIARSPVYSHISTTLQGLPTIRTFGQQEIAVQHFHTFNNEHTQGWYLYLILTRWFGIRLDFLSSTVLVCVAFITIPLLSQTDIQLNPALLGLGLTYTINLAGMFQYCVRQSTEVENIMISTERVMSYSNLESEAPLETTPPNEKPPDDWPSKGQLSLEDVAFRYSPELPLVLKNLCFSVRPSEKVGIVGRTGAGKSSLLSVLYRLAEPYGQITIDGVDTKDIGLHDLRKKMSIIPQDPVLFSGTMRYNLDPFDEYSDAELWGVLEQVQLKTAVEELEGQLSGEVSEGGSNFSVGQRQLVCLARALLRKNKILILDEATANVDPKTDEIIQATIRNNFTECSVLTIAHRLNTIMDSDRILVMKEGQVSEFDSPLNLLHNKNSDFSHMVAKTGTEASHKLYQMAAKADALRRTEAVDSQVGLGESPVIYETQV